MALVRELTTLLDFQLDASGVAKYEAAVNKVKSLAVGLGKLFGVVLVADKIYEVIDGLVKAGKEINILTYQLNRMARAGDDIGAAQEKLFQISQNTGTEYTTALETYKEFLNTSKELNVSQDQLLGTVDNIFKGLRLSAANADQMHAALGAFNRTFQLGRMNRRTFGMLEREAPAVLDAIAEGSGKSREALAELAKGGKITGAELIKWLGKPLDRINKDFAARPRKLGEAFNYAWNAAARLSAQLWRLLSVHSQVARGIVYITDLVTLGLTRMTAAVGGLEQVMQLLEIALAVALGPKLVMMLARALVGILLLDAASWKLMAKWLLIPALIAAATFAIADLIRWISGKDSIIGDFLGNFEDVKKGMTRIFNTDEFFAPIRAALALFRGDFKAALAEIETSFGTSKGQAGLLTDAIILMAGASVFGLLIKSVKSVTTEAGSATKALTLMSEVSFGGLLIRLGLVGLALWGIYEARKWVLDLDKMYPSPGMEGSPWKDWSEVPGTGKWWGQKWNEWFGKDKFKTREQIDQEKAQARSNTPQDITVPPPSVIPPPAEIPPILQAPVRPTLVIPAEGYAPTEEAPYFRQKMLEFMGLMFAKPLDVPGVLPGQVTGQAAIIGAGGTQDNSNTINQTNNITVEADMASIAAEVKRAMDTSAQEMLDTLSRQGANAAPRVEAPAH